MRIRTDVAEDEIDGLAIEVTRLHPRSKDLLPLRRLLEQCQSAGPPAVPLTITHEPAPAVDLSPVLARIMALEQRPEPVPAPPLPQAPMAPTEDLVARDANTELAERCAALERQVAELLASPIPIPAPVPEPQQVDMPAFMQRAAAERGISLAPVPSVRIEDVLSAIDEVERWTKGTIEQLARRLDEVTTRLDHLMSPQDEMGPPEPIAPAPDASIKTLTDWLQAIDVRATHAEQLAAELCAELERKSTPAEQVPPAPEPQPAIRDPRSDGLSRVRLAAEQRRNALIGPTADARDLRQRLAETAFNSLPGRDEAVARLERLASVQGIEWSTLAKLLISQHDRATDYAVDTLIEESRAVMEIGQAADTEVDRIVSAAIANIERIGV